MVSVGIIVNPVGTIGNNQVAIPCYFFKVLLMFDNETAITIAFLLLHVGAIGEKE